MSRARLWTAVGIVAILAAGIVGGLAMPACSEPRRVITLWHSYSGAEREAIEELGRRFNQQHPEITLDVVSVPYQAFSDKITSAVPNGNGPDLFVFAHDRIGDWAEAGILEPIEFFVDESLAQRFDYQALLAQAYCPDRKQRTAGTPCAQSLYGLPLAVKSLVLFYRTDLVKTPPRTTDELAQLGTQLTGGGRYGLVYENTRLYAHAAWLHGFGGVVFDADGNLQIASAEAARALEFARRLGTTIVPPEVNGRLVGSLFKDGLAAMALSGPWFISNLPDDVPWAVAPLPIVSATGKPASPFLGSEAVMMSSRAKDKRAAFEVMDFLTSDDSAIYRALSARQVVPNGRAYLDKRVGGDAVLATFRKQAEVATPMPSTPEMRMVWTPYDTALQKVIAQGAEPAAALSDTEHEIRGYIEGSR